MSIQEHLDNFKKRKEYLEEAITKYNLQQLKDNFDGPDLFYVQPKEKTIWKFCILTIQKECQIVKPPFDEFQAINLYNNLRISIPKYGLQRKVLE